LSHKQPHFYLWRKVICFVSFCFVISQTMMLHVTLLVSLESSQRVGVHRLGLRLLGAMVWKLLIIEPFFKWKLNKTETENCTGIWGHSWCCWKALGEPDLIEFISQFSELRCERLLIFEWILLLKIQKKIAKIGFGRKKSVESSICSHLGQRHRLH